MAKQKPAAKSAEAEAPKAKSKAAAAAAPAAKTKAAAAAPATPPAKGKGKGKAAAPPAEAAKPKTKSEMFAALATLTGLERKQVSEFFEHLATFIKGELGDSGPGVVKLPGLFKLERKVRPATPETQKANPFRPGEMMTVKAKPARTDIKVRPLKELKEMVS